MFKNNITYLNVALGLLVCMSDHLFYEELTAGLLAAGAEKVWVMSLFSPAPLVAPETSQCQSSAVAVEADEHRLEEAVFPLLCLPTGGVCTFHPAR